MLSISTNTAALMATKAITMSQHSMETSMERLSTGKRINSAADDAAGLTITSRLTSNLRGINQSIRNAMDAQAFIDTLDGHLQGSEALLQNIRVLEIQTASDTNSSADRAALEAQKIEFLTEIDRLAESIISMFEADGGVWTIKEPYYQIGSGSMAADTVGLGDYVSTPADNGFPGVDFAREYQWDGLIGPTRENPWNMNSHISLVDELLQLLNNQRGELGAISNRMDHIVANNTNTAINIAKSISSIEDADFAAETTNLAKQQILQQAAIAMLSQANASKQSILTLLKM